MNTRVSSNKKQTAFRFSEDLLERLKVRAKKDNRSLNNYVEKILMEAVYDEPNEETVAAMKEAKEGRTLETLDLAKLKEFVASLHTPSYVENDFLLIWIDEESNQIRLTRLGSHSELFK